MDTKPLVDATLSLLAQAELELHEAHERVEAAKADVERHALLIDLLRRAAERILSLERILFRGGAS